MLTFHASCNNALETSLFWVCLTTFHLQGPRQGVASSGAASGPVQVHFLVVEPLRKSPRLLAGGDGSSLFPLPNGAAAARSWAGQLEGLVGGPRAGGLPPASVPYLPEDRTGRISFKLFDKNPNDLPDDLRDQVRPRDDAAARGHQKQGACMGHDEARGIL